MPTPLLTCLITYGIDAVTQLCFYVWDHASVNVAIAMKTSVPMIGCASHQMNLVMQALMNDYTDLLEKVQRLMSKLNTIKNRHRHRLREADTLMPTFGIATRWSNTFAMIDLYCRIYKKLDRVDDDLIDYENTTLYHPPPVKFPNFENGIVKVLSGKERSLTRTERTALAKVLHSDSSSQVRDPVDHQVTTKKRSFAEAALAKEAVTATSVDLGWVPPTSNDVERLFSRAMTLETVMFFVV
ncbi:hypothetical protein F442_09313 [Phytophthora nicotianae P10297]|uniref:Uncharacterized protein n=1 Tax=Phytophthora nicotianae P10297 TaxID=1317064 RepID=W2ZAQ4_PHYNI|nr:hypothetical protein F442_09313 [Phytophthora nicotianae P10297]